MIEKISLHSRERCRILHFRDADTGTTYDLDVRYEEGGANYTSYTTGRRGIYMSIQPTVREGGWVRSTGFTGMKMFLQAQTRYNARRLDECAYVLDDPAADQRFADLFDAVKKKNLVRA